MRKHIIFSSLALITAISPLSYALAQGNVKPEIIKNLQVIHGGGHHHHTQEVKPKKKIKNKTKSPKPMVKTHRQNHKHDHKHDHAHPKAGHNHGVETENLFGFTLGSDTEHKGAKALNVIKA